MKKRGLIICTLLLVGSSLFAQIEKLLGSWQLETEYGRSVLVFYSENQLSIDGERANYWLSPSVIRVEEDYGYFDYPYQIQGEDLHLSFPDGSTYIFTKVKEVPDGIVRQSDESEAPSPSQGGDTWALQGNLCSWSGSSSSYDNSSYSRTQRVWFDGQGNFIYSSEGSFSSNDGQAYGGDAPGEGERGTYRIQGDQVVLTFANGEALTARVYMRQNNGQITELMYGETLFATGLCE